MNVELDGREFGCEFHHVQMYVDSLQSTQTYKKIEAMLNKLAGKGSFDPFSGGMKFLQPNALDARVLEGKSAWADLCSKGGLEAVDEAAFQPAGQDVVEQMIVGLGWRVTAEYCGPGTRSVLVTSKDPKGVKLVVTTSTKTSGEAQAEPYAHFSQSNIDKFFKCHHDHAGIAVLGFELPEDGAIEATMERYKKLHPSLLRGICEYEDSRMVKDGATGESRRIVLGTMKVLEAFAYYQKDKTGPADEGTVLRFVHRAGSYGAKDGFGNPEGVLPGLEDVPAEFDGTSIPAYADHWVSNVVDRRSFLDTLEDVLGFTPKVDFNAGVVAAGRAKIESTVTGNSAGTAQKKCDSKEVLRDQSQIYLPINNALSDVGHVHFFLEQLGQGVQHLASRVKNLVSFIERVNNYRVMTGRGFSFLNIPRSYYGHLAEADLVACGLGKDAAAAVVAALVADGHCTVAGIVSLDITQDQVLATLAKVEAAGGLDVAGRSAVVAAVKRARFSNMYALLRDHFAEETYLQIVRNKILVDIQGSDILFQIFTCNILQRKTGDEAPFLEFIQRVCSEKRLPDGSCAPIKPGCGGFGIRNFLTLFLSIEVSKAMVDIEKAVAAADATAERQARARVELFTKQLDESNPILTAISDAMTAEGDALDELEDLRKRGVTDNNRVSQLEETVKAQGALKLEGNAKLQELSERYSRLMEELK